MALDGEIMRFIGNELMNAGSKGLAKAGAKATLSSLIPKIATKAATNIATDAGADMATKALSLGLSRSPEGNWLMDTSSWNTGGTKDLKDFVRPMLGGEEAPNYQRFLEQIGEGNYRGSLNGHTPGWFDDDGNVIPSTLDNIEGNGDILPKIYGDNREATLRGLLSLGNSGDEARKSASVIANYRGKPNELATIYRQSPKDINYGGWVGLTDSYANLHEGNSEMNKLWSKQVPANEVFFAGDDINEWYYMPKEVKLDAELGKALDNAMGYAKQNASLYTPAGIEKANIVNGRLSDANGNPMMTKVMPEYTTIYHNTPLGNVDSIVKNGIKADAGARKYADKPEVGVWGSSVKGDGYGGSTIAFRMPADEAKKYMVNDTEYLIPRDIAPEDIVDVDRMLMSSGGATLRQSQIPEKIAKYGEDKVVEVMKRFGADDNTIKAMLGKNNKVSKYLEAPTDANATGVNIDIRRGAGDVQRLIDTDRSLSRLQSSPARGMLGNEQIQAYKRALNGENLSDEFLKNDKFARVLDEEVSKRPLLITPEQEADPSLIDPKMLSEFEGTARKFINQNLDGVERGRKAVIVLGRPSSGKSSGAVNLYTNKKGGGFFELDNDEIKKLLPGYDDGMGANAVHNASSLISKKMVLPELADNGYNIVLPIVGKKESSVMSYVDELANRGYEIAMINTNLPVEKCRTRNRTRAYETGRNVADAYLVSVGEKPDLVYNSIKEKIKNGTERRIGSYAEVSTDVPFGEKAILVENSGGELLARLSD